MATYEELKSKLSVQADEHLKQELYNLLSAKADKAKLDLLAYAHRLLRLEEQTKPASFTQLSRINQALVIWLKGQNVELSDAEHCFGFLHDTPTKANVLASNISMLCEGKVQELYYRNLAGKPAKASISREKELENLAFSLMQSDYLLQNALFEHDRNGRR